MSKNKIGYDSPIPKFIYLKIRRQDGVESLTILEEGEFKVPLTAALKTSWPTKILMLFLSFLNNYTIYRIRFILFKKVLIILREITKHANLW